MGTMNLGAIFCPKCGAEVEVYTEWAPAWDDEDTDHQHTYANCECGWYHEMEGTKGEGLFPAFVKEIK